MSNLTKRFRWPSINLTGLLPKSLRSTVVRIEQTAKDAKATLPQTGTPPIVRRPIPASPLTDEEREGLRRAAEKAYQRGK
jgi:hypothetical protein